ncbi:MAG: hypothetical protein AVDCRST_MAG78-1018 [uncultured Rubrobacteraceae bacterium]|uniref:Uncharacterized protein n=1 Tax=uncultured Rubrobacteraceae bacterium TaxID=349277 RepID=A0A6J4PTI9_9ACTN|nr:MAG: hypothetical protein AVDCRST_MAG78-1018 [uncultured Rubrobacteraceae bacterium]
MTEPRDGAPRNTTRHTGSGTGRGAVLALTLLFVLAAVSVSAGLVVNTAWRHDLVDGLFALAFAVLSARAFLSWFLWRESDQQSIISYQQDREGRKPADETNR